MNHHYPVCDICGAPGHVFKSCPLYRLNEKQTARCGERRTKKVAKLSLAIFLFGVTAFAATDGPAELPRTHAVSAMADTPAPGASTSVPANGLQAAINAASCGDTLLLAPGTTYPGIVTIPQKGCDDAHWLIIRSAAPDSALPAEGSRLTPCYSGVSSLPSRPALNCASLTVVTAKIVALKSAGAFTFAPGANHVRIGPGLEITRPTGSGLNYGLITKASANDRTDHIVIDRDWIHGTAQDETVRGVWLSGTVNAAIVDSYFSDFHCTSVVGTCVDSQAISGGSGTLQQGTWRIHNNFLEAAAENIIFGGTAVNSTTPTDIEITRNHLFKPLTWMAGQASFVGGVNSNTAKCLSTPGQCPFIVKNLLEFKNAQRVLIEGNILENVWAGFTQHGQSFLIEGANTSVNPVNSQISVADITFRYNTIAHSASGFAITNPGDGNGHANLPVSRISVHDDIFDDISDVYKNGDTTASQALELTYCSVCTPIEGLAISHITERISAAKKMFLIVGGLSATPIYGFDFINSIVETAPGLAVNGTGLDSPCGFTGKTVLARLQNCINPVVISGNLFVGATGDWPDGNLFPANEGAVGFGANLALLPVTAYKGTASDGTDPGADVAAVHFATLGVQ